MEMTSFSEHLTSVFGLLGDPASRILTLWCSLEASNQMAMTSFSEYLTFVFGFLGNLISIIVYLSPLITFYGIYKQRSTQNYDAMPYSAALFNAMLSLYYGYLKGRSGYLIVSINAFGCATETAYLITFFIFANSTARKTTALLIIVFDIGGYISLMLMFIFLVPSHHKLNVAGWINAVFSVAAYAAPLSVMRMVIKTKNVESLPFSLSFCLVLKGILWSCFGIFSRDYFIGGPNILGFLFGVVQVILYFIYRKHPKTKEEQLETAILETASDEIVGHVEEEDTVDVEK